LGFNVADPEAMDIPVTLILSYIFVGIMSLYAINLDVVSLFADSFFTFLEVLNDVIFRFEYHFVFVKQFFLRYPDLDFSGIYLWRKGKNVNTFLVN